MSSSNSKKRKSLSDDDESSSSSDQHEQKKPLDVLDHSELGKDLCLLKLPKELVQYQKENRNFRLNFKDIKSGEIFKIVYTFFHVLLSINLFGVYFVE